MRITSKGQVTIPQRLRERYGLMPETEVEFVEVGGEIVVRRAGAQSADRAQQIVDRMLGAGHSPLTTEEIIAIARGYDD
ncbi:MAG TPA: AbrB/MazE/SpoVT family DNA-binding domain-containing protein [Rhodoglobus sp.]|jgi:AbrB family looped-hinge helix DNA binding protein|nr:AbrB/MazE/SpoVT family DNA-binding domain-containing protein [Rhodoglobus sp.]HOW02368.1 AbrB/MazE/SpoVT family DNA-binding domain-containing protein [Rhodoglobus sp.]HOY82141.1 AbrB/MazE/SpoVT family DNA-binding domain-containing protein [Rhodoglobus sp.]HPG75878.1 AbrB/MazE/SpoVT family DNA-binding domain-containing protein [Rhodoglobus sp.]HPM50955.1 AbrB/MazE/SpoVT family DNA-binding domain-containing protein [Rhodoglobus sp.]